MTLWLFSNIYVNFISSLFRSNCLLFDKLCFRSPLHPRIKSISLANNFSYDISHTFLSFPMLFTNIRWIISNLWTKYLFIFSIFEYVNISLLRGEDPGFRLWFCLIKYWPKNKHGLKRLLTYGSISSVWFISSYNSLERATMPSVRVGISFYTKYRSL